MKWILVILFSIQTCFAATYYVKLAGGSGSGLDFANAWSYAHYNSIAGTLGRRQRYKFPEGRNLLRATASPVRGGREPDDLWHIRQRGQSGNKRVYCSYFMDAGTGENSHIYYASLTFSQVQNVVVDGVQRAMGRYPNTGYLTYDSHSANTSISGSTVSCSPRLPMWAARL
jgi:hypothetical protein